MAFDFHYNRDKYFNLQSSNCRKSIIPFIETGKKITPDMLVLEIGCRDGGVLLPFYENGNTIVGIDLEAGPVEDAKKRYSKAISEGKASFLIIDIHDYIPLFIEESDRKYDLILLKDVIEHVHEQENMIRALKQILNPEGIIYFGFPAWQSPFGGHQQVVSNKVLSKLPYIHILPNFLYFGLFKMFAKTALNFVKEIKSTGISIERFERIATQEGLEIRKRDLYFVSPMFEHKFGWKPRKMWNWLSRVPYVRNFFSTSCEYVIGESRRRQG